MWLVENIVHVQWNLCNIVETIGNHVTVLIIEVLVVLYRISRIGTKASVYIIEVSLCQRCPCILCNDSVRGSSIIYNLECLYNKLLVFKDTNVCTCTLYLS